MRTSGAVRAWRGDETLHQTPDTFIVCVCVCVWMGHGLGVWCRRGGVDERAGVYGRTGCRAVRGLCRVGGRSYMSCRAV